MVINIYIYSRFEVFVFYLDYGHDDCLFVFLVGDGGEGSGSGVSGYSVTMIICFMINYNLYINII